MKYLACLFLITAAFPAHGESDAWPGFRNAGNSLTHAADLPLHWSEEEGIAWRTDLAGYGQSSPVIFDGTVWVTSTDGERKEKLILEGFDLTSGKRTVLHESETSSPVKEVTDMISRGAPTPVVDANGLYAFFESGDLIAVDPRGAERWRRSLTEEFGPFLGGHGIGSSPAQNKDLIFLLIDHDGPSYLLAVNKSDGTTAWKADRAPRVSWTSPLLVALAGRELVIISSHGHLNAYNAITGELIASRDGLEGNNVPSPTWTGAQFLIGSSAPQQSQAVTLDLESGEFETAWKADSVTSSFGSPIFFREMAFFVNRAGALQATSLEDGAALWETRLPASTWASPVVAGDRIYFFCQDGTTLVLSPTAEGPGDPLAENAIPVAEGTRLYGVALADGYIVMRHGDKLIAAGDR